MTDIDQSIFSILNAGPAPNGIVVWLAIVAARYVILAIPVYMAFLWIGGGRRDRLTVIALLLALGMALAVSYLIGQAAFRPRPFMLGLGHQLIEHRESASFPSNHGLAFAVWASVMFMLRRFRVAWIAVLLGVIVAWSRIYLGVHFPFDMLGAVLIAIPIAMASLWVMARHGDSLLDALERLQRLALHPFSKPDHGP
ncbi:undecaprenyl-diphosphatase [Camelimonas fluminis]|uniref:Undecaprenyl-diphosphatase n=1 Tax=Camelimonas fluminis TaxID=1576911 RepID=A0ABV7UGW3_9HYPH|nr:undecaprenyl-diphosphatase [Camelimonas fluminis]GHE72622.1 undecaprenyl-diphosphatase [Camelimonas fluminis]